MAKDRFARILALKQKGSSGGTVDDVARQRITAHERNADIHISAAEKASWDGKAELSDIPDKLPANGGTADVAKKLTDWGTTYVTDADNAPLGLSRINNEGKNNPFVFWATLLTLGADDSAGYRQQWAFPWGWGEAPGKPKYRVKDNGTWFAWQSLPDGGNAASIGAYTEAKIAALEARIAALENGGALNESINEK